MKPFIKLLRVKHYVKNIVVLLPPVFAGQMLDGAAPVPALWGFVVFCLLCSTVYAVNDIRDAARDREHPTKRNRPVACGMVPVPAAAAIALLLLLAAAMVQIFAIGTDWRLWIWPVFYVLLNLGYSLGLKNIPLADIAILASGFLLRLLYGSAVTGIALSNWLCLTVIALSFYLGLGKRRNELAAHPDGATRGVLRFYTQSFLEKNMLICQALALVFYSLWSTDPLTQQRLGNHLVWTVPLALLICLKYNLTLEGRSDGDPVEVLFRDKALLGLTALFALVTVGIIYF